MSQHTFAEWKILFKHLRAAEFDLKLTLESGQCFQWKYLEPNEYIGVVQNLPIALRQHYFMEKKQIFSDIEMKVLQKYDKTDEELHKLLLSYFNMDVDLIELVTKWNMKKKPSFPKVLVDAGLRLLSQDIEETFISCITSANNTTSRIAKLLDSLRTTYGHLVYFKDDIKLYTFPTIEDLLNVSEESYKELGFGYRSNYIYSFVQQHKSSDSLYKLYDQLCEQDYESAFKAVQMFKGVGPKVADFILLSSCKKYCAIPCDTHIIQLAKRDFHYKTKSVSVNKIIHNDIQNLFKDRYGDYCGWTQIYLFSYEIVPDLINQRHIELDKLLSS